MRFHHVIIFLLVSTSLLPVPAVRAEQRQVTVEIEEHLAQRIPLDELTFKDEEGEPIRLADLVDRPIVLTLVYYRCPGICTPLLNEVVSAADNCDLQPGEDYRLITISFDPNESSELAKNKKANMLATFRKKQVPQDGWRFLTGNAEPIRRITDAVGFRYKKDTNDVDFIHAATVIFLSSDGQIVRYLNGTTFNPADLKLAIVDATEGRARSFMQRIQKLCYAFDPKGRSYVLKINRLILGVTLLFASVFGALLLLRGRRKGAPSVPRTGSAS